MPPSSPCDPIQHSQMAGLTAGRKSNYQYDTSITRRANVLIIGCPFGAAFDTRSWLACLLSLSLALFYSLLWKTPSLRAFHPSVCFSTRLASFPTLVVMAGTSIRRCG
ncbi:hypothetical protein BR93DRAFT_465084 [Coniochaeta sp. PMI_546]|nr:hypothetical protein BR93DRAFT_465084 [Coniochaeta sp. PMI_546]